MATLHLQFFSSLCTIINSIEGPRKHPTNWAPQLLRPALVHSVYAKQPDKFGIKFWLVVDVKSNYILNAIPYLGKDESHPFIPKA